MTQAQRITKLEEDLATVVWLHAEFSYAIKLALLQQALAQILQPQPTQPPQPQGPGANGLREQLQQALLQQLNAGAL